MELVKFPSRGGFSVRSILTFALTVLTAVLLWATFTSSPAHAATTAEWSGTSTILYDNHGYTKNTDLKDTTGTIPGGATVYTAPVQTNGDQNAAQQQLFVLYFAPGVDPPTAKSVTYVAFDYKGKVATNPHGKADVTITPQNAENGTTSSCQVSGIGWIVCPVSNFLADAMDNLFNILAGMIKVQPPVLGDTNNSMYVAWNVMRTIANVAFVIVFIIIIYSQLTSLGISNYGLKKLIPRLIVAAVLVNLSFFIAALAIDISNIAGFSIQDIFNGIRTSIFHVTNDNLSGFNTNTWGAVTAAILAGGGLVGGVYYMATGGLYLLLPLLLMLGLTVLLVVVILAARQAIILILVIISPLAFVANLLPNTEKWFEKWKDLFMTMLIFFPAFSLVFGGSQLAGQLIIQNAGDNIVTLLFGMAVQIAPLVITPLILKLSGGLLGKIAQITNNPNKGLMDRSRNWAQRRAENAKYNNINRGLTWKNKDGKRRVNPAALGAGMVRRMDYRKRRLDDNTEAAKQEATNRYQETRPYGKIHERMEAATLQKEAIHNKHAAHIDHLKATKGTHLNVRAVELEGAKVSAERASAELGSVASAYRAGNYDLTTPANAPKIEQERLQKLAKIQSDMASNVIQTAAWNQATENNKYRQQHAISSALRSDTALLDIAQGSGDATVKLIGRERAQASAIATLSKLNKDARENTISLIETEAVESGMAVKDFAIQKIFNKAKASRAEYDKINSSRLEAALEIAIADGQVGIFNEARASEFIDQSIIDAVVARNVGNFKAKGGFHTQADPQLSLQRYIEKVATGKAVNREGDVATTVEQAKALFERDLKRARLYTLSNTNANAIGGLKAGPFETLAEDLLGGKDPEHTGELFATIPVGDDHKPLNPADYDMVKRTFDMLRDGLTDPSTRATMSDRIKQVRQIEEAFRAKFFPEQDKLVLPGDEPHHSAGPDAQE